MISKQGLIDICRIIRDNSEEQKSMALMYDSDSHMWSKHMDYAGGLDHAIAVIIEQTDVTADEIAGKKGR